MTSPNRTGIGKIADALSTSRQTAKRRLAEAGILPDARHQYPFAESVAAIRRTLDPSISLGRATGLTPTSFRDFAQQSELATTKVREVAARARKLELANDKATGRLIEREHVLDATRDFATRLRANFQSVGSRVAPRCEGRSADEIARIVNDAVADILTRVADIDDYLLGDAS